jgi:hypothetical protein
VTSAVFPAPPPARSRPHARGAAMAAFGESCRRRGHVLTSLTETQLGPRPGLHWNGSIPPVAVIAEATRPAWPLTFLQRGRRVFEAPTCSARNWGGPPTHFSARHAAYFATRRVFTTTSPFLRLLRVRACPARLSAGARALMSRRTASAGALTGESAYASDRIVTAQHAQGVGVQPPP